MPGRYSLYMRGIFTSTNGESNKASWIAAISAASRACDTMKQNKQKDKVIQGNDSKETGGAIKEKLWIFLTRQKNFDASFRKSKIRSKSLHLKKAFSFSISEELIKYAPGCAPRAPEPVEEIINIILASYPTTISWPAKFKPSAARTTTKRLKRGTCNQPGSRSGQSPGRS
jgi:hypothetical protein